ncbi:MAG TPA: hypothetical protein VJ461_01850, partial [Candidatus Nanoarchaeia archaeon]|nr:hypothetical protein [Candidatus Nanoarchaeia archaeon]
MATPKKRAAVKKQELKKEEEQEEKPLAQSQGAKFGSFWTSLLPINKEDKARLELIREALEPSEIKELEYLLKTHKARFAEADFETSSGFLQSSKYLSLASNVLDPGLKQKVAELNQGVVAHEKERIFLDFASSAEEKILGLIAPNIIGLDEVK